MLIAVYGGAGDETAATVSGYLSMIGLIRR